MTKKVHVDKPYKFITKDYTGKSEVLILKGKGTIKSIDEKPASGTAQVIFEIFTQGSNPKPLRPEGAWYSLDNTVLHEHLKEAQAAKKEVAYRIEIKRRPGVDVNTPFMDLYQNMDDAKDNTVRILALADDVESSEAITVPSQDPTFNTAPIQGKTVSELEAEAAKAAKEGHAVPQVAHSSGLNADELLGKLNKLVKTGGVAQPIIDSLAALSIASGATTEQVNSILYSDGKKPRWQPATNPGRSFASEAPRWEEFNSDGRLNLGSGLIASAISIESAVSRNILNNVETALSPATLKGFDSVVAYFVNLSYSICDYSQVKLYGAGARVERKAESHTRIRGIFIDLLERFYPFPVTVQDGTIYITSQQDVDQWVKNVGGSIVQRFVSAVNSSQVYMKFSELKLSQHELPVLHPSEPEPDLQVPAAPSDPQAGSSDAPAPPVKHQNEVSAPEPVESFMKDQEEPFPEQSFPTVEAEVTHKMPPAHTVEKVAPEAPAAPEPELPAATETVSTEDRANMAQSLIKNFIPTAGIYSTDEPENEPLIPDADEEEDSDYVFVTDKVIKLPSENYEGERASSDDVETFKQLLDSLGFNLEDSNEKRLIGKIIKYTFGDSFSKLQELPSATIQQFIDWYASVGEEAVNELRQLAHEAYS